MLLHFQEPGIASLGYGTRSLFDFLLFHLSPLVNYAGCGWRMCAKDDPHMQPASCTVLSSNNLPPAPCLLPPASCGRKQLLCWFRLGVFGWFVLKTTSHIHRKKEEQNFGPHFAQPRPCNNLQNKHTNINQEQNQHQ